MPVNTRGMSLEDVNARYGRGPGKAIPRWDYDPAEPLTTWFDRRLGEDPRYQLPAGFEVHDGRVERDTHGLMDDILKWMAIGGAMGAGGYGTLAASGAFGGGAAGAAGAGAGAAAPAAAGSAGAAAGAAATGAGTMPGWLSTGMQLAPTVTAGINALRGRGQNDQQDALTGQQQQLIDFQLQRLRQSDPLYQAILKLAMGLMPTSARPNPTQPNTAQPRPRGF